MRDVHVRRCVSPAMSRSDGPGGGEDRHPFLKTMENSRIWHTSNRLLRHLLPSRRDTDDLSGCRSLPHVCQYPGFARFRFHGCASQVRHITEPCETEPVCPTAGSGGTFPEYFGSSMQTAPNVFSIRSTRSSTRRGPYPGFVRVKEMCRCRRCMKFHKMIL